MQGMREKHPFRFATLLGAAIGTAIGLAYGTFETCLIWMVLRSRAHGPTPPARLRVMILLLPPIICCLLGALTGALAASQPFGKRASVLFPGLVVGALVSLLMGLGLEPLGGPLAYPNLLQDPAAIFTTCCLVVMMAVHPCWPEKPWARIVSALGVAGWILSGLDACTISA